MHVAIIPDGNRRWAKEQGLVSTEGHEHSVRIERITSILRKAKELKLTHVSIWAFSTENWNRSVLEKNILFKLLTEKFGALGDILKEENVRFRWIGRRDRVPKKLKAVLEHLETASEENSALSFQICLDYGGRDEILRAVNKAVKEGEEVTEDAFSQLLDTKDLPDPDLILRTSGEQRLSGFFAWQGTYAELYFSDKYFPDFGPDDFAAAVEQFRSRQRRFGH